MIKILHFISDSNIGGAGKLLCNLISNMNTDKFNITVALPRDSALITYLEKLPCDIIKLNSSADTSFSFCGFFEACKTIRKIDPDIVHSHASLSSRLAASFLSVKSRITTKHCSFPTAPFMKAIPIKILTRIATNLISTSVIATSLSAQNELIKSGVNKEKIKLVINGSNPLAKFSEKEKSLTLKQYGLNSSHFIISIFARVEEYKGHRTLLEAASICKKKHPNFRFFIVGNGSQINELKRYAKFLKIEDTVIFTGFVNDPCPIFNITHINVNCSYLSETSSLAISEGMSLGIPCIASDCGGNPNMVKHEENGLIFAKKDAQSLARALIRLYEDKSFYQSCSICAQERFSNEFSAKIMAQKMMEIYESSHCKRD